MAAKRAAKSWWRAAASLLMRRHLIARDLQAAAFARLNPNARQQRRPQNLRPGDAAAADRSAGPQAGSLLHQPSADTLTTATGPIEELRQQEATNRQELLEWVAYS
jgi:hypothetical protein